MSKLEVKAELRTIFQVQVGSLSAQFSINEKDGSDAEVSFDGGPGIPANAVYRAVKAFEDRFPEAFEEES